MVMIRPYTPSPDWRTEPVPVEINGQIVNILDNEIYRQGQADRKAGCTRLRNRYKWGSDNSILWEAGWLDADTDIHIEDGKRPQP